MIIIITDDTVDDGADGDRTKSSMAWTSRPTTIELFLTMEGEQKKSQLLAQRFVARIDVVVVVVVGIIATITWEVGLVWTTGMMLL